MTPTVTYGDIGNPVAGWYSRNLLAHAMPQIISERFGLVKTLPKNQTRVIQFRRPQAFGLATSPLQEGVTPDGSGFNYDTLTAYIHQFGDYTVLTDVLRDTSIQNVFKDVAMMQGEQIGATKERLTTDVILHGTSVGYGATRTTRNTITKADVYTGLMQRRAVKRLQAEKAKMFTRVLGAMPNFNTFPIEASYIGLTHTDMVPTLRDMSQGNSKFRMTSDYSKRNLVSPYEIGGFENVRYVAGADFPYHVGGGAAIDNADKPNYEYSGSNYTVYPILILGRDAFGCIALRGRSAVRPMVSLPKVAPGDPLGQRGTVGWMMWHACIILNDFWMYRFEVPQRK